MRGWTYAKYLLRDKRVNISQIGEEGCKLDYLKHVVAGMAKIHRAEIRQTLSQLKMRASGARCRATIMTRLILGL